MERVRKNRPKEFEYFSHTRIIIIGWLDFLLQRPGLPSLQRKDMEHSNKSHNSFKALLGIAPDIVKKCPARLNNY
jgi:hypothetical protein